MRTVTSADGTAIAYEVRGDGPPVVLVGGARLNAVTAVPDAVAGIAPAKAQEPEQSEVDVVAALRKALES